MSRTRSQTRTGAPAAALISDADAKAWLRVSSSSEDDIVSSLVSAATAHLDGIDGILGRALITQTWVMTLAGFPAGDLLLDLPPVQSVSSVTYYDADNASQTVSASDYRLVIGADSARLELTDGAAWPSTYDRGDAVAVTYVTGYGDAATDVPAPIITAAKLMLANWFENREGVTENSFSALPMGVRMLLMPYRVPRGLI